MQHHIVRIVLVAPLVVAALLASSPALAGGDKEKAKRDADYEMIQTYIYDERYQEALKAAQSFLKKYPADDMSEAANFWSCYALDRTTGDHAKAFECYRSFLQKYPNGKWVDDATIEYAKLAKRLARAGDPRGKAALDELQEREKDTEDDADFKLSVLYALKDSDPEGALQATKDLLKHSDPDVRKRAVFVLADFEEEAALDQLIGVAKSDPDPDVRRHAIYAISEYEDEPKVIDTMVAILKSEKDLDIRRHALYAIAEVDRPDVTKILVDVAMKDPDEELRTAATYALAEVDSPEAAKALEKLAMEGPSFEMKRAALYALIEREDTNIIPLLKKLALSTDKGEQAQELRRAAVYALAEVDDPSVVAVLSEVVKTSDDPEVKQAAFYALAEHGGPEAINALKAAALDTKNRDIALAAVYGLGDLIEGDSAFFMEVYKESPFEEVRRAALHCMSDSGDEASVPALGAMLQSETNNDQRRIIVWTLADIPTDESVAILAKVARSDPSRETRRIAVQALGSIGTPAAKKALRDLLSEE